MRDDDIVELLRRRDPARGVHDTRTESQISEDLHAITSTTAAVRPTQSIRRHSMAILTSAVACILVAIAVLLIPVWDRAAIVTSAAPPLLELTPTNHTVDEVLDRAIAQLNASPPETPERHATFESWSLGDVTRWQPDRFIITPQVHDIVWSQDLSGTITTTVGHSFSSPVGQYVAPGSQAFSPKPGATLSQRSFDPGRMAVLFQRPPPSAEKLMRSYLNSSVGLDLTTAKAGDYLRCIRTLLDEWTIDPEGQAALLRILGDTNEITVAGEVTDRLGRAGVALRMTSSVDRHVEYLLILGVDTGRILAVETIDIGGAVEGKTSGPTVTEYTAWR